MNSDQGQPTVSKFMKVFTVALRGIPIMLAGCMALLAGCGHQQSEESANAMTNVKVIPTVADVQDLQRLSQLKIAIGHQSVGGEIIDGLGALARESNVPLAIAETRQSFTVPALHHFKIGRNSEPDSKLRDFEATMSADLAGVADIALMKFCYIDFTPETNPKQLAQAYIAEIESLSTRYPQTTFVPVTAPLTTVQTGPKAIIKKLMGRVPAGYESNVMRKEFNEILRAHYADSSRLFDIAAIESDFGKVAIEHEGRRIEALDPALTYDGGHLNDRGRRLVGGALAHHLVKIKSTAPTAPL